MQELDTIADSIQNELEARHEAREAALSQSRSLIRQCANAIRAMHRNDWDAAQTGLTQVRDSMESLVASTRDYPDLYYAGYTQDALKEYVEAFIAYALVRDEPIPTPAELDIEGAPYLNGLCEAASELRRRCLDLMRHGTDYAEAEELFRKMDTIYGLLMGFDFLTPSPGGCAAGLINCGACRNAHAAI